MNRWMCLAAVALACGASGAAAQSTSYRYDAQGRLVRVVGPAGAGTTDIGLDAAGNRTSYTVTGSSASSSNAALSASQPSAMTTSSTSAMPASAGGGFTPSADPKAVQSLIPGCFDVTKGWASCSPAQAVE